MVNILDSPPAGQQPSESEGGGLYEINMDFIRDLLKDDRAEALAKVVKTYSPSLNLPPELQDAQRARIGLEPARPGRRKKFQSRGNAPDGRGSSLSQTRREAWEPRALTIGPTRLLSYDYMWGGTLFGKRLNHGLGASAPRQIIIDWRSAIVSAWMPSEGAADCHD